MARKDPGDKVAFDPNQPYEEVGDVLFDPNQPYEEVVEDATPSNASGSSSRTSVTSGYDVDNINVGTTNPETPMRPDPVVEGGPAPVRFPRLTTEALADYLSRNRSTPLDEIQDWLYTNYGVTGNNLQDVLIGFRNTGAIAPVPDYEPREMTQGELLARQNGQSVSAPAERSWLDRTFDSASEMASEAGEGVNAAIMRRDIEMREEALINEYASRNNLTEEERQAELERNRRNRTNRVREERAQRNLRDEDEARRDPSTLGAISRFSSDLVGDTIGDANLSYLITGPASSALGRVGVQGFVNAGTDAAVQADELNEGIVDEYDVGRTGLNFVMGAGFQGAGEVLARVAPRTTRWSEEIADTTDPVNEGAVSRPQDLEQLEGDLAKLEEAGADISDLRTVEQVRQAANDNIPTNPEDVVRRFEESVQAIERNPNERAAMRVSRSERLRDATVAYQRAGGGEAGYFAHLNALKGKLSRGTPLEEIRSRFNQEDIDILYNTLENSDNLTGFETTNAFNGLSKILDPEGAVIPNAAELRALQRVFDPDTIKHLMRARPMRERVGTALGNALTLPRTLMSTADLSAPLRQGSFLVRRPEFRNNLPTMGRVAFSEGAYNKMMTEIRQRPSYTMMEDSGLAITDMDGPLAAREEDFMSNWGEKIPVAGRVVRGSNRGYSGYLNKLRADTFDSMVETAARRGNDISRNPEALEAVSAYINAATGRGNLPDVLKKYAPALNATLFSPRLISSRLNLLFNPMLYARLPRGLRREAAADLLGYMTYASTLISLGVAAGASVERDPRSSDFLKIRFGDTRYDILGGFQQYLKLAAVMLTGEKLSSRGDVTELGEEGFNSQSRLDELIRFVRTKLSPNASYIVDALDGQNIIGEEFEPVGDALSRLTPLFVQDLVEAGQNEGTIGVLQTLPAFFGIGVSNYETGLDRYGRDIDQRQETDPAVEEMERLSEALGEGRNLIGYTNASQLTKFEADEDQVKAYQELSGQYIRDYLNEFMQTEEWAAMTDEEKIEEVRAIARDMREVAREELFPEYYGPEAVEEGGETPVFDPNAPFEVTTLESSQAQTLLEDMGLRITDSGVRPREEQERYFRQANGVGVSAPGTSAHEFGQGIDIAIPTNGTTVTQIRQTLESAGFRGVEIITIPHGTGPHWHIEWESVE